MTSGKIFAALFTALIAFGVIFGTSLISFSNTEVDLRSNYEAKTDANKADFDAMWKIISQTAQVPEQYKNGFAEVYGQIMEARYDKDAGGTLMRWITEQNPQFDSSLYARIQTVVEGQRTSFATRQKELRDVKREHDKLLRQFPGAFYNVFLSRDELDVVLVTSDKTEKSFETGKDDSVNLFPQPTTP